MKRTTQILGMALAFTTALSLAVPMTAQADVVSQEVVMGVYNTTASMPTVTVANGSSLELHLFNYSNKPMTFAIPSLSVSTIVPPNVEKVVSVDAATLANASWNTGNQLSYVITDEAGNQTASGFVSRQESTHFASASSVTTYEQTTTSSSRSSTISQPEPMVERPVAQRSSAVRGYW